MEVVVVGILVVGAMSAAVGILPAVAIAVDTAGMEVTVDIEADTAGTEVGVVGGGVASGSGSISRRFPTTTQRFGTPAYLTTMRMIITTNGTVTWVSMKL